MQVYQRLVIFLLLITTLVGCFGNNFHYTLTDSTFIYEGELLEFITNLYIEKLVISIRQIPIEEYNESNNKNVIEDCNAIPTNYYYIEYIIKYENMEEQRYDFTYLGLLDGRPNTHRIRLYLDNEEVGLLATFGMIMEFTSKERYYKGIPCDEIKIYVQTNYEISGNYQNTDYKRFPSELNKIELN